MAQVITPDISVNIGSLNMKNPVTTASGTFAAGKPYSAFYDISCLGAVTTKGVSAVPWEGNDSPRIAETPSGMLNSIGLQNPGVEEFCKGDLAWLRKQNVPIIVNIAGHSISDYKKVIERLEDESSIDAYELNISCPNVDCGGMTFGVDPKATHEVVSEVRKLTRRPLIAKLTPNVTDITVIAKAAEEAGADAVSLINTLLGMAIDLKRRRAVMARRVGGLSGPAVKPVALRMIYEVSQSVSIPIIGMGGICTTTDALEFILAGATAVAVGTANFIDPCAAQKVAQGILEYCKQNNIERIGDFRGTLA